jgi:hypothetical protein
MRTSPTIIVLFLALLLGAGPLLAADSLVVKEGESIRLLSERHLGDSELWPEFLRANDLDSVADIHPGMTLKLPAPEIVKTQRLLKEVREKIQRANRMRARLFAPTEIGNAVANQDQALEEKRLRRWKAALVLAEKAVAAADQALAICEGKSNVAAEAQLVDSKGQVQYRRPQDVVWSGAELYGMFGEGERVRTLADASAELLFRDDSRLRMDENSQIVIEQMRANLLENRQQAKVSLVSGDLFALLGGNKARDQFDVNLPGIKLDGDSRDFYVRQDKNDTKLANYQGELAIEARGSRVVLEENEGVAVDAVGISGKRSLLPRPTGMQPEYGAILYTSDVELAWKEVEGAELYWLEVSSDANFKALLRFDKDLKSSAALLTAMEEGSYFWRVAAVDEEGFPGPRSESRSFQVIHDRQPPYLVLLEPEEGARVSLTPLTLRGMVEQGSSLTFREEPVQPDREGDFAITLEPQQGPNEVVLLATDSAGNISELRRNFTYEPERPLFFEVAETAARDEQGRVIAMGDRYQLNATTLPDSRVTLKDEQGRLLASATADPEGALSLNLELRPGLEACRIEVESPGGNRISDSLQFIIDAELPQVTLNTAPPRFTRDENWSFDGQALRTSQLLINGEPVALQGERFSRPLTLGDGENLIDFVAIDPYGNRVSFQRAIFVDRTPPRMAASRVQKNQLGERLQWRIELKVEDDSALRRSAPFTLQAGDFTHDGVLRLDGDGQRYIGLVETPPLARKQRVTGMVLLGDTLGNEAEVGFR